MADSTFFGTVTAVFDPFDYNDQTKIRFSIAEKGVSYDRENRQDFVADKAFWTCEWWLPTSQAAARVAKGDQVRVEGSFGQAKPKAGEKTGHTRFTVRTLEILGRSRAQQQRPQPRNDVPPEDNDVPPEDPWAGQDPWSGR